MKNEGFAAETSRARTAQRAWQNRSVRDRLDPIRELRHLFAEQHDRLTDAVFADISRDSGEVLATDILSTAAAFQFLLRRADGLLKPVKVGSPPFWLMGCRDVIHRRPHGLVGVIGTWNYPIYLNAIPIAHALVAGNAVLWKPSEQAPRSASVLHEMFIKAGVPADVFQILPATREGGPMLAEASIDFLQFTGSDGVGRKLAARLGERLIPSILELSGVDACIVLPDADPVFAARAIWFGTSLNSGQTCLAVRRVFVHRSILPKVIDALTPLARNGPMAKLVLPSQAAFLQDMAARTTSNGGTVITRTNADQAGPTFLINAPADIAVDQAACFAPVSTIRGFDAVDEVIQILEQGAFGLSCSIFTGDPVKAEQLAPQLRTGSVIINDVIAPTAHPETPFGGRGASGWGVTQGGEGLLAMTVPQVVTIRKGTFRPHYDSAASGVSQTDIVRGILESTHGRTWWGRTKAKMRTVLAMMRQGKA